MDLIFYSLCNLSLFIPFSIPISLDLQPIPLYMDTNSFKYLQPLPLRTDFDQSKHSGLQIM